MAQYTNIFLKVEGGIATLVLNRPEQLNAMNRAMMEEIINALEVINANAEIRAVVITGAGRAFMAGADIKEYAAQTPNQFMDFQRKGTRLYELIETASIPYIAAINGFALGGGFEIALACDMIVAAEGAQMGLPEVLLSLIPGGGGTQRLIQKVNINRVKEMLYLGRQYSAQEMQQWGLVYAVTKDDKLLETAYQLAEKLSRRPKQSIAHLKKLVHLSLTPQPFNSRLQEEGKAVFELYHSEEAQKRISAFVEKNIKS